MEDQNKKYNKLVRDKIPEIIDLSGKKAITEIASDGNYKTLLINKLKEELDEFVESGSIEELADIYEVILAILAEEKVTIDMFLNIVSCKRFAKGAFNKRIVLLEIQDNYKEETTHVTL